MHPEERSPLKSHIGMAFGLFLLLVLLIVGDVPPSAHQWLQGPHMTWHEYAWIEKEKAAVRKRMKDADSVKFGSGVKVCCWKYPRLDGLSM